MKKIQKTSALAGIITLLIFLFSSYSIAQQKGGQWQFENDGSDDSGWDVVNNEGFASGSAIYSSEGGSAEGNYYLSLEDSASYGVFTVDDQDELDFNNENLAVSLWAYSVTGYDNPQHLVIKGERSGQQKTNNYALRINNGYFELIVHSESGANSVARSSFKVEENKWTFLAVFYDYENAKLYMWNDKDSAPVDTFDFDAPLFPNDDKLYVGTSGENGFKRFWGRVDDLRISSNVSDVLDNATSIETPGNYITPLTFELSQNYPNPFNPETSIRFVLEEKGFTRLTVYNVIGMEIAELINGVMDIGEHKISFNAGSLPSGVYLYKIQQGSHASLKKMLLVK